jgi:hypothetical protein
VYKVLVGKPKGKRDHSEEDRGIDGECDQNGS